MMLFHLGYARPDRKSDAANEYRDMKAIPPSPVPSRHLLSMRANPMRRSIISTSALHNQYAVLS